MIYPLQWSVVHLQEELTAQEIAPESIKVQSDCLGLLLDCRVKFLPWEQLPGDVYSLVHPAAALLLCLYRKHQSATQTAFQSQDITKWDHYVRQSEYLERPSWPPQTIEFVLDSSSVSEIWHKSPVPTCYFQ